ncbi:uncharacterized protein ACLA_040510 [Aspergillus clavatus NRRL 1]|uniref:Uncharacterized protein n=1 Tax=Aspergillus clavatus (strain ATCC 1007 / CBS 513.65 / DSM 816 / NCTC 3887 / NRRL 1 / QM 1276 / 107) TaxID=344612 RepID=A1CL11_ASPCL|nr:uncharacterized protein ACLA_040510 [Aspergillus clavatus NRRL 1]EAW09835.1 hypothetical protein ACLA_040510 [Aspergillus clavatus NRRL 1]
MIRFKPSSIAISEKDLQYHLEKVLLRRQNQVVEARQHSVERSYVHENQAASISPNLVLLPNSRSSSPATELGLNSVSDVKLDHSLPRKDRQETRSPSPTSPFGNPVHCQQYSRRGSEAQFQLMNNVQENSADLQEHHDPQRAGDTGSDVVTSHPVLQHNNSSCGINGVGSPVGLQKAIGGLC